MVRPGTQRREETAARLYKCGGSCHVWLPSAAKRPHADLRAVRASIPQRGRACGIRNRPNRHWNFAHTVICALCTEWELRVRRRRVAANESAAAKSRPIMNPSPITIGTVIKRVGRRLFRKAMSSHSSWSLALPSWIAGESRMPCGGTQRMKPMTSRALSNASYLATLIPALLCAIAAARAEASTPVFRAVVPASVVRTAPASPWVCRAEGNRQQRHAA
jgi:hypothetical protein